MEQRLDQLLEELYRLDPSLRAHEKTLKPLIQELLASKPDIQIDPQFQQTLHTLIQARTSNPEALAKGASFSFTTSFLNLFSMNKLQYSFAGVALATLLIVPIAYNFLSTPSLQFPQESITPVEDQAFGPLVGSSSNPESGDKGGLGGGGETATADSTVTSADEKEYLIVDNGELYPQINVRYVYEGDPLTLDASTVDVLKRVNDDDLATQFGDLFQSMDLGLLDLSKFEDMEVTYLNLVPSDNEGFSASLDLTNNTVSLFNYETAPMPVTEEWIPLTESDMLSDDILISMANDFIQKYGISVEGYGAAKVVPYDTTWGYPDNATILYPTLINGETAYEAWGNETGLSVNISIRDKKVTGMWGIQTQQYQSSAYAAATDSEKILSVVGQGGLYSFQYENPTQTVEAKLGTPTRGYFHTIIFNSDIGSSEELYVPALIFPVTEKPDASTIGAGYMPYVNDYVVVPLAADMLEIPEDGGPIMY